MERKNHLKSLFSIQRKGAMDKLRVEIIRLRQQIDAELRKLMIKWGFTDDEVDVIFKYKIRCNPPKEVTYQKLLQELS